MFPTDFTRDFKDLPMEKVLEIYRRWLEKREVEHAIHERRREEALAKTSARNQMIVARQFDKWRAREERDISELKFKITLLESQIAERDEEARKRTNARAWLDTVKKQARESWLENGGTLADFVATWPEIERKILLENTMESLTTQPNTKPSTKRNWSSWSKLNPPPEPKKKKRVG